jgi:hypothetical protein
MLNILKLLKKTSLNNNINLLINKYLDRSLENLMKISKLSKKITIHFKKDITLWDIMILSVKNGYRGIYYYTFFESNIKKLLKMRENEKLNDILNVSHGSSEIFIEIKNFDPNLNYCSLYTVDCWEYR